MSDEMTGQTTKADPNEKKVSGNRPAFGKLGSDGDWKTSDWIKATTFAAAFAAAAVWGLGYGQPVSKTLRIAQVAALGMSFVLSLVAAVVLGLKDKKKSL